jgi:hypothetical protein
MNSRWMGGMLLVLGCFSPSVKAQMYVPFGDYGTEGYDVEASSQGDVFVAGLEWVKQDGAASHDFNGWLGKFDRFRVLKSSVVFSNGKFSEILRDNEGNLFVLGFKNFVPIDSGNFLLAKYSSSLQLLKFVDSSLLGLPQESYRPVDFAFHPDGDILVLLTGNDASGHLSLTLVKISPDLEIKNTVTFGGTTPPVSWGIALAVDGQGHSLVVAEVTEAGTNTIHLVKYDDELNLVDSRVVRTSTPNEAFYVNDALADNEGNWVLAGFEISASAPYDRIVWMGSWKNDLSDLKFETLNPFPDEIYPRDLAIRAGGSEIFLSGHLLRWEKDGFGFDSLFQKGWVGTFSDTLVLSSSKTFSGTHPGGANFADGVVWKNGGLYVTGAVTNPDRTSVYLDGPTVQVPFDLLPSDDGSAKGGIYPNPFIPRRGHTVIQVRNMPENSQVQVFTISGRKVAEFPIRSQAETWNVRNVDGDPLGSGVYFLRVYGAGVEKVVKILVQR